MDKREAVNAKSDEALLADHVAGVPGALDLLVQRYVNELFGFLSRYVANSAAAEDLVQDTFVQVHLAAETFDRTRSFRPWLYTIAANKARDWLRSRGRRQERSLDAGDEDEGGGLAAGLESDDSPLSEALDDDERRRAVREIVNRLPEHLRTMLLLGYFQQLPYAEIAEVLEIPVGTVKSRLHAAVGQFAKLWNARYPQTQPSAAGDGDEGNSG